MILYAKKSLFDLTSKNIKENAVMLEVGRTIALGTDLKRSLR